MKNNAYGTTWGDARTLALAALATMIMASGTASAAGDRTYTISGNSTFSSCGKEGSDFALRMTGDLQGCLSIFVKGYTCKELPDFDHYTERGWESFNGTWRGRRGTFSTNYKVDAAYAKGFCQSFDFSLELSGSCIHNITGRSGVFADAEGVYTMFDVITNVTGDPVTGTFSAGSGANNFLYFGTIRMGVASSSPSAEFGDIATAQSRSGLAAGVAARKAQSKKSC